MPRAGLDPAIVVAKAAEFADEVGLANLTMGLVAERLGVRTPSLYKHIDGLSDLNRQIGVLAMTEMGDALRDALQGRAGKEALAAAAHTIRAFVLQHPGRYAATTGVYHEGPRTPSSSPVRASSTPLRLLSPAITSSRPTPSTHCG